MRQVVMSAHQRITRLRSGTAFLWAANIWLAVLAVILLAGTNLIGLPWFCVTILLSAAAAWFWVRRRIPSPYSIAQQLDTLCGLQDALSTDWYLQQNGIDTPAARFQHAYAERAAAKADVVAAFPAAFRTPVVAATCLAVVVCAVAYARYSRTSHLDLHPSFLALWSAPPDQTETPNAPLEPRSLAPKTLTHGLEKQVEQADSRVPREPSSAKSPGDPQSAATAGQSSEQKSAFQRMKEALSDLLDEFKPNQSTASESASPASEERNQADKHGEGDKRNQESKQQSSAGNQEDLAKSDSGKAENSNREANRQSDTKTRQGQGGMSQSESNKPDANGNSAQSGAGSENGAQRIATAAELKAMGKIEQLMGQRAAQVSGDMTVVSSGGPQKLSTKFTGHDTEHRDVNTTVTSEPVRPEDREFVRRYMDEMHRITDKQEK